jgi:hypothetical protein
MLEQVDFPELILFIGSLLVAAYMFAAIKFPALRFIFSLRSGIASAAGVGHEKNQAIGQSLGVVLCPLIGVIAVGFALNLAWGWYADHQSDQRLQASIEDRRVQDQAELTEILRDWEIDEIYFDRMQRIGVSEQGESQARRFWEALRQDAVPPEVVASSRKERDLSNALHLRLKPADGSAGAADIALLFDEGLAAVVHNMKSSTLSSKQGFAWTLPESVGEGFDALSRLERIDLNEVERQARIAKAQEQKRLNDYQEKTYAGPPAWQLYELVNDLPEDQRKAKVESLVGTSFDWECEVDAIEEDGDELIFRLSQNRPSPGTRWPLVCRIPRPEAGAWPAEARRVFVRIRGVILSIDKRVHIQVSDVQRFSP